jgi:hypothetical protein
MTRFHFTFDIFSDDDASPEEDLVYSDDEAEDENDAPEYNHRIRWNSKNTSRYALECCDTAFVDCSLVEYSQYPSREAPERASILLTGRNAATASIPALCQLSLCSPRYDAPLASRSTALTLRDEPEDIPSYDRDLMLLAQGLRQMPPLSLPAPVRSAQRTWALLRSKEEEEEEDGQELRALRQQLQQQHAAAQQALHQLLQRDAATAARIQTAEQELRQKAEQAYIEQQAEQEATLQREQEQKEASEEAAAASTTPPRSRRESVGKSPASKSPASRRNERVEDHVARAWKLRTQLVELQQSVADFETSAQVKERRLPYKKLVNGRINTLAENVRKIVEVAYEVEQAIVTARQADEANKTPSSSKSDVTILGKRYLVNLLASKVMVRAQAEGFNGYVVLILHVSMQNLSRFFH